jgi:uncharacterized protein YyaL (SSP411 family)
MYNRPGFPRVLKSISATFADKREQVERGADEIVRVLQRVAEPRRPGHPITVNVGWIESLIERSIADYDQCYGGFSDAPKFPRQTLLEMLLYYLQSPDTTEDAAEIQKQVLHTLDQMAEGGIRDQLGGGFHRYSTDEKWLVPHFEIMLYDNAMLAVCYVWAWQVSKEERYARVTRGILDFVIREMAGPSGEFYTAFDAEVDAQEGLSYLWTPDEVREVLAGFSAGDVDLFMRTYGLLDGPNFADPHHGNGQPDKNILFWPVPPAAVVEKVGVTEEALEGRLAPMRASLYAVRSKRKQPLLDTKVLTSWNALMIRAFAVAGAALHEARYVEAATRAATFLLERHRMGDGSLVRTSRPEVQKEPGRIPGFLDDYAFFAQALLALNAATEGKDWRDHAVRVVETMKEKFGDRELGGFFFTPMEATDLIVRQKAAQDSPLPSGNAVAAMVLAELGEMEAARRVLAVFAQQLEDQAEGMSSMAEAALVYLAKAGAFTVADGEQVDRPATPGQVAKGAVELAAEWVGEGELHVRVKVLEGFHINANRAAQGLIPTTLGVSAGADSRAVIEYPPGEERRFAFANEAIRVYDGEVVIVARVGRAAGVRVRVTLTYQACTEDACLPATSKSIEV